MRVFLLPDAAVFRLIAGCVLLPLGLWLCLRTLHRRPGPPRGELSGRTITGLALGIGVIGGIYGIGGGSILGPILVGRGQPVTVVAPAALASTFAASLGGAATYAILSLLQDGAIAPNWTLGLLAGAGGLIGGYTGARLQPHLPETLLRVLLGATAIGIGLLYLGDALL